MLAISSRTWPHLAAQVADQLTQHDALDSHARDELGISPTHSALPLQAAWASAASFAVGAGLPLAVASLAPPEAMVWWVPGTSVLFLAVLGAVAARVEGAGAWVGAARVTFRGAVAMAITAGMGRWFDTVV